ncbi:acetyltransferase [Brevibacterium salitolerans]|uniref:acetyltransferase n=1 Tax=Brevibacterium salitolerans TaxID=1403566 RepID=UPI0031D84562
MVSTKCSEPVPEVVIRGADGPAEHPRLVQIWRSAVDATHDFLSARDRDAIEARLASAYFPHVRLHVAELAGEAVGFAGTADGSLEMLFVDAGHRGRGIGGALLAHVLRTEAVTRVDVNEQNAEAAGFYAYSGFRVVGRSEFDGEGRPYPLLHMELAGLDPDLLLAGPRGRRLLLEFALASAEPEFSSAVFLAAAALDPEPAHTVTMCAYDAAATGFAEGAEPATTDTVGAMLADVRLAEPTAEALRSALTSATESARYWQEPDGEDLLAAAEPVRTQLRRVAVHIAASPYAQWLTASVAARRQWSIQWEDAPAVPPLTDPSSTLRDASVRLLQDEAEAAQERPEDPTAGWSGAWWSTPSHSVPSTTGELVDGTPAGLCFVEDGLGWQRAAAHAWDVPSHLHILEIDGPEVWADLCRRFPLEVTGSMRHDWFRTTGRNGRWVVPDWAQVAEHFDGVHLTPLTYLAAAGTAISVGPDTASVIAGWNPDQTFWFSPAVGFSGISVQWELHDVGEEEAWRKAPAHA